MQLTPLGMGGMGGVMNRARPTLENVIGTVFIVEESSDADAVIGIETDDYDLFIEEGEHYEELRELVGETILAEGSISMEKSGERWLDLQSFDVLAD
jgi:hypothetical protein